MTHSTTFVAADVFNMTGIHPNSEKQRSFFVVAEESLWILKGTIWAQFGHIK